MQIASWQVKMLWALLLALPVVAQHMGELMSEQHVPAPQYSAGPLRNLVIAGSVGVAGTGAVLFYYFAWLQSGQPWTFTDWLHLCTGQQLFDAARTTVAIVGLLGLGGAALIAYRRQHTSERTLLTAIESQNTAARAVVNASHGLDLDRQRHAHETSTALRSRYTDAAEQLGSSSFAVRLAGVYSLASLADDWHKSANDDERQVCIHLLCAYLRTDTMSRGDDPAQERQIRTTIISVIRDHTRAAQADLPTSWTRCRFDFSGADLAEANLVGTRLDDTVMVDADLECADLSGAHLRKANLTGANLRGAKLVGTQLVGANLTGANLSSAAVLAQGRGHSRPTDDDAAWGAPLIDRDTDLSGAVLRGAILVKAQLISSKLTGATLEDADLLGANLTNADLENATLRKAKLLGADLTNVTLNEKQKSEATWNRA